MRERRKRELLFCLYEKSTQKYLVYLTSNIFCSKRTWISWPLAFILRSGAAAANRPGGPGAPGGPGGVGAGGGGGGGRAEDVAVMAEKEVSMR